MATLDKDQRVSYELETGRRGKISAVNLQSLFAALDIATGAMIGKCYKRHRQPSFSISSSRLTLRCLAARMCTS
jgi:hypothetical protein